MSVHTASDERFFRKPPLLLTLLLVALAVGIALIFWTIPNLGVFSQNVTQFPALWQDESNRMTIVLLSLKVFSWLLFACLIGGWCWLVYSTWCFLPALTRHRAAPAVTSPHSYSDDTSPVPFSPTQQTLYRAGQPITAFDPITPLPPTLDFTSASAQMAQTAQIPFPPEDQSPVFVTINVLEQVQMVVHAPDGAGKSREVDLKTHMKRLLLLAYIAHVQNRPVERNKMLYAVFGPGRTGIEAELDSLVSAFSDQKKAIRLALRDTIKLLNEEEGREVIPPNLDVFAHDDNMSWWLDPHCRVSDLEALEAQHLIIEQAEHEGRLKNCVTEEVNEACQAIFKIYRGDFLARLIVDNPREFENWNGKSSWVRRPFTLCRDYYLQALWYAAGYELQMGQERVGIPVQNARGTDAQEALVAHFERAARLYRTYALYACNTRFDAKVSAGRSSAEPAERVVMSEYALRSCLLLYSAIGTTAVIDQIYADFVKQMKRIVGNEWEPGPETVSDRDVAKSGRVAYRLPLPILCHGPFPYNLQRPASG